MINNQPVTLIADGKIMDNELDESEIAIIKNVLDLAVIHDHRTYLVSTKGSGASMIYITDFPKSEADNTTESSHSPTATSNIDKQEEVKKQLTYISENEAYLQFNNEWKKVCHTERVRHEQWRQANI